MQMRISQAFYKLSSAWTVALAILVYGYFIAVVMPEESARSESYAGDWGAQDGHLFFTPNQLYQQIATWGPAGRESYISFRLGLDILWALAYTSFLITITSVALRRAFPPEDSRRLLNLVAIVPLATDYTENALGILITSSFPVRLNALAWLAAGTTSLKWASLGFAHVVMLYALFNAARNWRRPVLPRNR